MFLDLGQIILQGGQIGPGFLDFNLFLFFFLGQLPRGLFQPGRVILQFIGRLFAFCHPLLSFFLTPPE
ncbi:MAG: hypothetical protein HQK59_17755 [Deltaproteobacteria bacterium]|nr:hypothetical protein [Deltaproteobacteria bacterium]